MGVRGDNGDVMKMWIGGYGGGDEELGGGGMERLLRALEWQTA